MSSLSRPGALAGLGLLCVLVALGGCAEPGPNPTHEPEPVRATPANQTPASATPANVTPASPAPPAETPPIRHIATLADELAAHPPQPAGASLSPAAPASSPAMPVLSAERRRAQQTMLAALREFVSDRDTGKARDALVRAAGEDPSYAEPPYNLAILAEAEENWAEAIRYYEQVEALATPQDPLRKTAAEKLGLVRQLEADSQTPEGKLDVQYTLSVDRARQFLAAQQPAEAVAEAERAITLLPNRYEAYCVAALAERELGAFESAIGRLRHAKEVAPAEMIPKLDSSLQELETDEAYATTVASAGDALAAGQYDQAAGLYADALRTKPSEQQIGLKLATALVLAGNTEQARPVMNGLLASRSPDVVYGATLQLKALDMAANAEKSQAQIVEATRMTAQMQEEAKAVARTVGGVPARFQRRRGPLHGARSRRPFPRSGEARRRAQPDSCRSGERRPGMGDPVRQQLARREQPSAATRRVSRVAKPRRRGGEAHLLRPERLVGRGRRREWLLGTLGAQRVGRGTEVRARQRHRHLRCDPRAQLELVLRPGRQRLVVRRRSIGPRERHQIAARQRQHGQPRGAHARRRMADHLRQHRLLVSEHSYGHGDGAGPAQYRAQEDCRDCVHRRGRVGRGPGATAGREVTVEARASAEGLPQSNGAGRQKPIDARKVTGGAG